MTPLRLYERSVARLFALNACILFGVLFALIVTIDVIVNLDRFAERASEVFAAADGTKAEGLRLVIGTIIGVWDIWGPRLLQLFAAVNGVVLVAAMGFTCVQLVRHRELVALIASGTPVYRLARPLLLVTTLFVAAQAATQELLIPAVAPLLTRDAGDSGKRDVRAFAVRLAPDDRGRLFYARRFHDDRATLEDVTIFERADARITRVITAQEARYDGNGWTLLGGFATTPSTAGAPTSPRTPIDRIDSSLDPAALKVRALQGFGQSLSWTQITDLISEGALDATRRAELDRLRWGRIAALASTIVTVIAAMPFFLRRVPGPMLGACLQAAPIAGAGLIAAAAAPVLPLPGLPIPLAAFVPTLVLVPIAIALVSGIKT